MKLDERAQQASRAIHIAVEGVSPNPLPSRRVIAARRAAIALVLIAIVGFFSNQLLDDLVTNLRVETADQPPSEVTDEGSSEEDVKSDSSAPGPASSVAPGRAEGTSSPGTGGSSKDSRSGANLPGGTIAHDLVIAFNRGADIYLMNADGTDVRKLRAGAQPEWSPEGKFIAFTDHYFDGGDIQLMNADGSGLQNLRARGSSPTWSPDGRRLAFNWECDAQFGAPCGSPDGSKKDCGAECGIGVVARDGTGLRRLGDGIWPDWGPDGRIIFTDGTPTGPCYYRRGVASPDLQCALPIWVMNPDGSGRTRLPIDKAISPTWSRDGSRIAYSAAADGVFIANSDGTGIAKVAPSGYQDPSWSPDGLWLALTGYTNQPSGEHSIFLRRIDGSVERRLTTGGNDFLPAFSPRR